MRFLFGLIFFSVIVCAAIFFAPFALGFLFFFLFFVFMSRIFFWRSWRRHYARRGYYPGWRHRDEIIIPIDGRDAYSHRTTGTSEKIINISN
jgi:hypothetical protein